MSASPQLYLTLSWHLDLPGTLQGLPPDGREALAFTGSLLLNCPAMDAFLLAKISWVSLLGCTGEVLGRVVPKGQLFNNTHGAGVLASNRVLLQFNNAKLRPSGDLAFPMKAFTVYVILSATPFNWCW